jgi:hypothetical protein
MKLVQVSNIIGALIVAILVSLFAGAICYAIDTIAFDKGYRAAQQEAIKAGHAEMVIVDKLTGKTEFKWKELK